MNGSCWACWRVGPKINWVLDSWTRPICLRPLTSTKKNDGGFSAHKAALGGRTKKTGQSRWFIGFKKHTLRLWLAHYSQSVLLVPLMSWAVPPIEETLSFYGRACATVRNACDGYPIGLSVTWLTSA